MENFIDKKNHVVKLEREVQLYLRSKDKDFGYVKTMAEYNIQLTKIQKAALPSILVHGYYKNYTFFILFESIWFNSF